MGDFYQEDRSWAAYNDRRDNPGTSATTIGSALFTVAAGVYVLYKILDSLGYPVWLWAHMALGKLGSLWTQDMVSTDAAGEDTQGSMLQRGGNMLGSMFGLKDSGFIQKGVRGVTSALAKGTSDVPPGLSNWDNSCFQNSIIQGTSRIRPANFARSIPIPRTAVSSI
jgi:ubiquitin carboxyl-terminal hydrolase 1